MDFTDILENLSTLTDAQMKVVSDHMEEIRIQRETKKRKDIINNFKEAFLALREANINISYFADDDCEVNLYDYDGFCFY